MSEANILEESASLPVEPEAAEADTRPRVSLGFLLLLSLANVAMWLVIIPLQQILQPLQVALLDPANKEASLSIVLAVTGITSVITQPIMGAISDRTTFKFGRRRTWILAGMILCAILLILQANANSIAVLAIESALYGFFIGMIMTPVLTIIPDRVPVSQRATASAFVGLAQPVGIIIGSILIAVIIKSVQPSYYVMAGILVVILGLFVLFVREKPLAKEELPPFKLGEFLLSFFAPLKVADFAFTWVGRFLVIFAQIVLLEFMLYYLNDVIHYVQLFPGQTAEQGVSLFQVINTVSVVISTLVAGILSDKLQRRKPFILAACVIMAIGLFLIAFVHSWPIVLVTGVIFGCGFGIFLSADIALATQVLPKGQSLGKDLGLITAANTLPQLFFPLVSFLAFSVFNHSYTFLFGFAGVLALLGGLAIAPIKSVR
ncbi:MFS transporter [Tengunoibacter tsumagoiensis]|uniref:MFS transporter n=1 Tax=Tengunoibacter tsumagoiensis TaxID=2014871 RepID=A0A402A3W2_9CHLR|nr:MFS transporter [Tengunoibacter tsumagoiensis]GCE13848.1 MFS transporter [Tengunoibacter tsumagoiensis]